MNYIETIILSNKDGSERKIRCYEHDGQEFRFNLLYKIYINRDGSKIYDYNLNRIEYYTTKGNKNRNYYAFNTNEHTRVYIHRIIAFLFVDGYDKELVVDHIDNDPFNNTPENLQYITHSENIAKETGCKCSLINIYTNQKLEFNSKSECCKYFCISDAAVYKTYEAYYNQGQPYYIFIQEYINILENLKNEYLEQEKVKAAETVENVKNMLLDGWIFTYYKTNIKAM